MAAVAEQRDLFVLPLELQTPVERSALVAGRSPALQVAVAEAERWGVQAKGAALTRRLNQARPRAGQPVEGSSQADWKTLICWTRTKNLALCKAGSTERANIEHYYSSQGWRAQRVLCAHDTRLLISRLHIHPSYIAKYAQPNRIDNRHDN